MQYTTFKKSIVAAALMGAALAANATEGGLSVYPNGTENFMLGALPPPGLYGMVFGNHYEAKRVNDNGGNDLNIPGFKVQADVVAARLAWVPGAKILGGDLVAHIIIPVVNLSVNVPGASQSKSGIGDITTGLGVGFHHSPNLHSVAAIDLFLPTGAYNKTDLANIGKNHFAFEPVYALSYIDPKGFNGDLKFGYIVNSKNDATNFTSGNEFHFDYAAGWGLGNGWTLGVGGYVYQQTTDDSGTGATSNYASAMAIGPSVKYDSGKGWFGTLKFENEFNVKNRAQGNSVWLKAVFPL
jgi:hypothetical protein